MFFKLVSKSNFLQDCFVSLQTFVHPAIMHNIGKIEIIKKAFHQVTTECIEGDYFEFGVYEGTSLYGAAKIYKKISSPSNSRFYKKIFNRNFYEFDSFDEGFKYSSQDDKHPFFREGDFSSSFKKCSKRLKKFPNIKLIKGYFENTIQGRDALEMFSGRKCAILFIDCDLTEPALISLEFMKPLLQKGTIIILDDYFAYHGNTKYGTCGALQRFLSDFPKIKVRDFLPYGYNGKSFIVHEIS